MGKDFVPLKRNHLPTENAIKKLYWAGKVRSASKESYFYVLPDVKEIDEVELGSSGTKESVFRFKNGDFVEVEGTIRVPDNRERAKRKLSKMM
jgi:hypothetical protein